MRLSGHSSLPRRVVGPLVCTSVCALAATQDCALTSAASPRALSRDCASSTRVRTHAAVPDPCTPCDLSSKQPTPVEEDRARNLVAVNDQRAICADCGHVWSWHDRDGAHRAARMEAGIDRPCYREVGGAPCRCKAFRDSGEIAVAATGVQRPTSVFRNGVLTLLLVVLGLALLYAYRSQ